MNESHPTLLTPKEVAREFRIASRTQRKWRQLDPAFRATVLKLSEKRVLFDRAKLEAWFESRRQGVAVN